MNSDCIESVFNAISLIERNHRQKPQASTQKSGKTFLNELNEVGLRNCKVVPRTLDIWVGINRLRRILPRFSFRIPACERLLEGLSNYHMIRATSTGLALDEPGPSPKGKGASDNCELMSP